MYLAETNQQPEESFLQGISELYYSIKPNNSFAKSIFDLFENCGHQVYDAAVKYGPACVDVLSKSTAKLYEFSFPTFDKLPLVLQNFLKSSDEIVYLSGRGFFKCEFGRFTVKSLDRFTYSCERLLQRLQLVTKDTVIVLRSENNSPKPLDPIKQTTKDTIVTASPSLDGKPTEIVHPAPKIEPSTTLNNPLSTEAESSAIDTETEQEELAELKSLSIPTTVYENVTGLEKAFVMLYDAFVLYPVNATVAFIRFARNVVRDLEEFCHGSKDNVTNAGRHVKSSSFNTAALKDRLRMLHSDIVDPMKPKKSVLRLESKESVLSKSKGPLSSLMDTVNYYWEESDPDYVPIEQSSDSCTESGDSESDISVETINGLSCIKEDKPVKIESEQEFKPKDKEV